MFPSPKTPGTPPDSQKHCRTLNHSRPCPIAACNSYRSPKSDTPTRDIRSEILAFHPAYNSAHSSPFSWFVLPLAPCPPTPTLEHTHLMPSVFFVASRTSSLHLSEYCAGKF